MAPSVSSAPTRLADTHPAAVTTAANAVNTVGGSKNRANLLQQVESSLSVSLRESEPCDDSWRQSKKKRTTTRDRNDALMSDEKGATSKRLSSFKVTLAIDTAHEAEHNTTQQQITDWTTL